LIFRTFSLYSHAKHSSIIIINASKSVNKSEQLFVHQKYCMYMKYNEISDSKNTIKIRKW
jgi:hypothetical protein